MRKGKLRFAHCMPCPWGSETSTLWGSQATWRGTGILTFKSSQPKCYDVWVNKLWGDVYPCYQTSSSPGGLPAEAPDSVEQRQVISAVPCPNSWGRDLWATSNAGFKQPDFQVFCYYSHRNANTGFPQQARWSHWEIISKGQCNQIYTVERVFSPKCRIDLLDGRDRS